MNVTLASVWERTGLITRGALFALAVSACGQSADGAATTSVTDTATAYEALSNKVKDCKDDQDTCVTAAAGDATKVAACDAAAESCIEKTKAAQADARKRLRDDAEGCVRECRHHRGDSDGGVDEGGRMDTRGCMNRRAPIDSECMDDFFSCLDDTGVRMSGGAGDLDDATKEAIQKCVETAHTCMMSDMRTGRGPGRRGPGRGPGMRGGAGEPAHSAGAGGGPVRRPRDEAGAGGSGRRQREEAGAGGDEDNGGRRGTGRGAAGSAPDRGGRRSGAGGAGGN